MSVTRPFLATLARHAPKAETSIAVSNQRSPPVALEAISGAPEELTQRTVRIYKPAKTAMQAGEEQTRFWRLEFEPSGTYRWENPMMGWTSTADPVQAIQIKFRSKEDAIHFAGEQGWRYTVQEPNKGVFRVKVYAENFQYSPGKLKLVRTK